MTPTTLELLAVASALVAFSGLPGLLLPAGSRAAQRVATWCHVLGCAFGGLAAALALAGSPATARFAWPLPGGALTFALDRLSAFFLVPVFVVSSLGSVYGEGYWAEAHHPKNGRKLRCFYGLATAGLALVMVAGDAWSFLVGWEIVSLAAFFLVTTDQDDAAALRAGWIYFVSAHAGTLILFAMFALLRDATGAWLLAPSVALGSSPLLRPILLLALAGFGLKAGVIRRHIWIPDAHAAAPSHVSALLSGVVLKMGIYGLVRVRVRNPDVERDHTRLEAEAGEREKQNRPEERGGAQRHRGREKPRAGGVAEQSEHCEEDQRARVGRHEIDPPRAEGRGVVLVGRDEEEGGERDDLPADEEAPCVAGDHHEHETGRGEAIETAELPAVFRVVRLRPVAVAVDRAEAGNDENRHEEERRKAVQRESQRAAGQRPGEPRRRGAAGEREGRRRDAEGASQDVAPGGDPLCRPGSRRKQQTGESAECDERRSDGQKLERRRRHGPASSIFRAASIRRAADSRPRIASRNPESLRTKAIFASIWRWTRVVGQTRKKRAKTLWPSGALKSTGCRRKVRESDGSSAERAIGFLT